MGEITKLICNVCRRVLELRPKRDAYKVIYTVCDKCRDKSRRDYNGEPEPDGKKK